MSAFTARIGALNDTDIWGLGIHIMCAPIKSWLVPNDDAGFCLFMEADEANGGGANEFIPPVASQPVIEGISGVMVKTLLPQLQAHNCKGCGSIPIADNDSEEQGSLKLDGVDNTGGCNGICPPTSISYDPTNPLAEVAAASASAAAVLAAQQAAVVPTAPVLVPSSGAPAPPPPAPSVIANTSVEANTVACVPTRWGCSAPNGKRRRRRGGEDVEGSGAEV